MKKLYSVYALYWSACGGKQQQTVRKYKTQTVLLL